jgi:uncharacterized protein
VPQGWRRASAARTIPLHYLIVNTRRVDGPASGGNALLLIARHPTPGAAKTRLCPPLSGERASALYEAFLLDSLEACRRVPGIARLLLYSPRRASRYFRALAPDFVLMPQRGAGLGQRLDNALSLCFYRGFQKAAVLASDSPTLPPERLEQAFTLLDSADVVLGPSEDGGYYLIAASRPVPRLLREVEMSTPSVLQDTLSIAAQEQLRVALLSPWYDVDTAEDLARLERDLANGLGDAAPHTLACLRRYRPPRDHSRSPHR